MCKASQVNKGEGMKYAVRELTARDVRELLIVEESQPLHDGVLPWITGTPPISAHLFIMSLMPRPDGGWPGFDFSAKAAEMEALQISQVQDLADEVRLVNAPLFSLLAGAEES